MITKSTKAHILQEKLRKMHSPSKSHEPDDDDHNQRLRDYDVGVCNDDNDDLRYVMDARTTGRKPKASPASNASNQFNDREQYSYNRSVL